MMFCFCQKTALLINLPAAKPLTNLTPNSRTSKWLPFLYKIKAVFFEHEAPSTGSESTDLISQLIVHSKSSYMSFFNWEVTHHYLN